ncbi:MULTISPECIES: hypothetical protein [Halobacterium]|nr:MULTISPECIES: hypothetical protein [Halobacterium]MCG1004064.1 hypothetical protein [Halobacterium noricense]
MLQHTSVIGATVGQSSLIGAETPDDDEDEEQRARGVGRLLSALRPLGF